MDGPISEREVVDVVRGRVARRGKNVRPDDAVIEVEWHELVRLRVTRLVETRSEERRVHHGHLDLSGRPTYGELDEHEAPLRKGRGAEESIRLVRQGSVTQRSCDCDNGRVACGRCKGSGDLRCDPWVTCKKCLGKRACLRCEGSGDRRAGSRSGTPLLAERRVTCTVCGEDESACPSCQGRGRLACERCGGDGLRQCPECEHTGMKDHKACGGTGHVVTWTEGTIARRRSIEEATWPETGVPYFARQRAYADGDWSEHALDDADSAPDELSADVRTELRRRLEPRSGEVHREARLRHLPLARAVVRQDPHRVYYLYPGRGGGLEVCTLPSQKRTWQFVAAAAALLVLVVAVLNLL